MAAKLKVFVTSDGLTDYAVATTSRPKALAAWGVHQDLFKQGAARESDDAALAEAARARPGEVVERPTGAAAKAAKAAPRPAKRGPSKAALKKVADLERQLEDLDDEHRQRTAELEQARAELAARERREAERHGAGRDRLSARLEKARAALKG